MDASFSSKSPIFTGENYGVWAVKMRMYLKAFDLWDDVENERELNPLNEDPTMAQLRYYNEQRTKKFKALTCIHNAVNEEIFSRIMACETAKEAWDKLKAEFQGDEKSKRMQIMNLRRQFEGIKMKGSETVKEFSSNVSKIVNQMRMLGEEMQESRVVEKVLVSLPEKFENKICSLEESKDFTTMSLQELINALQTVEQRQALRQENTSEEAFAVGFKGRAKFQNSQNSQVFFRNPENSNSGNSWQRRNWPNNQTQGNNFNARWKERREPLPTCKYCQKNNHLESSCWLKNIQCRKCKQFGHFEKFCNEDNANQVQVAEVEENKEEMLFSATETHKCNKKEVNIQTWSIDSGCSNHMSAAVGVFENLDLSYKSRVKVANGQYVSVEGKGEVKIETLAGIREFKCVMYVPNIDQNLISVGQLLEDRHSLLFIDNKCMIKDDQGTLLFSIKMSNRCFSFEKQLEHQSNSTGRDSVEEKGSLKMAGKDDEYQTMVSRGSVELRETHLVDLSLQEVGSLYCDETCKSISKKGISLAALVPDESVDPLFYDANENIESPFRDDHAVVLDSTYEEGDLEMAKMSVTSSYYFDHECYDEPEYVKELGDIDVGKYIASSIVVINLDTRHVVDLDGNGNLDILVGTSLCLFYVLDQHGNTRKNVPLKIAETQGAAVAADINDDEKLVAEFRTNMKGKFETNELGPLAYCLGRKQCKMEMKDYCSREQWTDLITLAKERLEELRRMVENVQLRNQGGVLKSGNHDSRPAQDYKLKEMITS